MAWWAAVTDSRQQFERIRNHRLENQGSWTLISQTNCHQSRRPAEVVRNRAAIGSRVRRVPPAVVASQNQRFGWEAGHHGPGPASAITSARSNSDGLESWGHWLALWLAGHGNGDFAAPSTRAGPPGATACSSAAAFARCFSSDVQVDQPQPARQQAQAEPAIRLGSQRHRPRRGRPRTPPSRSGMELPFRRCAPVPGWPGVLPAGPRRSWPSARPGPRGQPGCRVRAAAFASAVQVQGRAFPAGPPQARPRRFVQHWLAQAREALGAPPLQGGPGSPRCPFTCLPVSAGEVLPVGLAAQGRGPLVP